MFSVRIASDWVVDWRQGLNKVVKAFIKPIKPRDSVLDHPGGRARISANRFDVPRHQDGHHDLDGSGGEMESFSSSVRVGLREAISRCGLVPGDRQYSPRRNGLQVIGYRFLAEPFL